MSNISRRQLLKLGIFGGSLLALSSFSLPNFATAKTVKIPSLPNFSECDNDFNPLTLLRDFDYGITKRENGRTIREFQLVADSTTLKLNAAISFVSWNVNGRVPGPTLRAKEGDIVRIIFHNQDGHSHTLHFHGIHSAEMDGVIPVKHYETFIYEFEAKPFGVHLYH